MLHWCYIPYTVPISGSGVISFGIATLPLVFDCKIFVFSLQGGLKVFFLTEVHKCTSAYLYRC